MSTRGTEAPAAPGAPQPGRVVRWAVAALMMAAGLAVTLMLWQLERREVVERQQARFDHRVQEMVAAVRARMAAHEQVLRGGASLVASLDGVTRVQWRDYVAGLDLQHQLPGFQGIGWARSVGPGELGALEQRVRAEGLASYQVRPPGAREVYAPVTYLEPNNERNLRAHGFDMMSEPTRRAAMERARDSGQAAVTARLKLASEAADSAVYGFLMYLPVYRHGTSPSASLQERRTQLLGYVNSPFRVRDLLRGALGQPQGDVNLRAHDGATASPDSLMHDDGLNEAGQMLPGLAPREQVLAVPGHTWTLHFTPLLPLGDATEWAHVHTVVAAGVGISVLLASLTWLLLARVEQSREAQVRFRDMALTDQLTGLPNRVLLHQRLTEVVEQSQRSRTRGAVLFVDLDNFKSVNDSQGHHAGDAVLRAVATRLSGSARAGDIVTRLGGDEFCIVLTRVEGSAEAAQVAQRVIQVVSGPIDVEGRSAHVGASVGIAMFPEDGDAHDNLLRCADTAMYRAKLSGKQRFQFFSAEMNAAAAHRAQVEQQVRQALHGGGFALHYQPVVDMRNGRLLGAEALLRLVQPQGMPFSTSELVAVAEQCGLIHTLGPWVIETACAQLGAWQQAGAPGWRLAVNVSARQLHDPQFTPRLTKALQAHGLSASQLELELTETALLVDQAQALRTMHELRDSGVALVLDDFGTGYSSLSHLLDFPIRKIKIDRRFVCGSDGGLADTAIAQAIIAMSLSLGLEVVAEGVETQAQCDALMAHGCHAGQGRFFCGDLDAAAFFKRYKPA